VVSSKYDLNTQVGQIENFIANKVDMIVLNAADSKGVGPAVKKAKRPASSWWPWTWPPKVRM
jgi:ribose transport system substrate-binding protein